MVSDLPLQRSSRKRFPTKVSSKKKKKGKKPNPEWHDANVGYKGLFLNMNSPTTQRALDASIESFERVLSRAPMSNPRESSLAMDADF